MSATTADDARCAACGARLATAATWCSLCMAPVAAAVPDEATRARDTAEAAPAPAPTRHTPTTDAEVTPADEEAERLLARLREEAAGTRPLARGPLAGASRGLLIVVGVAAAVALTALLAGGFGVLGMFL